MRYLLAFVFIGVLGLVSCQNPKESMHRPFTNVLDFELEIQRLDSPRVALDKRVYQLSGIESKHKALPNWSVELKPFVDADFNQPANKEHYTRVETISELTGWREVMYTAKDETKPVQYAIYRYDSTQCIGAMLHVQKNSEAYQFNELLTYFPQYGYSIDNTQDLTYLSSEQFHLEVSFAKQAQPWRMYFDIGDQVIPVNFDINTHTNPISLTFHQGIEKINVPAIKTDSGYHAEIPVFQSYLDFQLFEDSLNGTFHNLDKSPDYIIPFSGMRLPYDQVCAFSPSGDDVDFSGKWETYFDAGDGEKSAAIGLFDRLGNDLFGTFATETGDYRYLQGKVIGDSFSLSTFDGSHLYLFTGKIKGNQITDGHFYSGTHYQSTFTATRNNSFELRDPETMTHVTSGNQNFDFTFPNLNGDLVSFHDAQFKDKVVIVQILGSWCPNCMDETKYFKELYAQYHNQGVEIIGLAFERSSDFETAKISLQKAISDLQVPYPMLIAGTPKESGKALPMLSKIVSYPTSVFLNRKGEVIKVHTGFYGPSTGEYYEEYKARTEKLLKELL